MSNDVSPSLSEKVQLLALFETLVEVSVQEGEDRGGYDCNLASYYGVYYYVQPVRANLERLREIAGANPATLTTEIRERIRKMLTLPLVINSQHLDNNTSYIWDSDREQTAIAERNLILKQALSFFGTPV